MKPITVALLALAGLAALAAPAAAQTTLFITPPGDGFEVYIAAAMTKKKVPVTVMSTEDAAALVMKASPIDEEQVGTGKRVVNCLFASCAGNEDKASTSVQVVDKSGAVVWSYAVNKGRGAKNKQSMAEAIAEHFDKEFMKKRK